MMSIESSGYDAKKRIFTGAALAGAALTGIALTGCSSGAHTSETQAIHSLGNVDRSEITSMTKAINKAIQCEITGVSSGKLKSVEPFYASGYYTVLPFRTRITSDSYKLGTLTDNGHAYVSQAGLSQGGGPQEAFQLEEYQTKVNTRFGNLSSIDVIERSDTTFVKAFESHGSSLRIYDDLELDVYTDGTDNPDAYRLRKYCGTIAFRRMPDEVTVKASVRDVAGERTSQIPDISIID